MAANRTERLRLGRKYASALHELSRDTKNLDKVESDLASLNDVVTKSLEFSSIISNPLISKEDLGKIIETIAKKIGLSSTTTRFCTILANNRRLSLIPEIKIAFDNIMLDLRSEANVKIISATKLGKAEILNISDIVKKSIGKTPVIDTEIDETILGGIVIQMGSKMLDASLSGRLNRLQSHLKNYNT